MGAAYSLQSYSNDEMNTKEESKGFTPSKRLCDMRVLELDPRSPTDFFHRTPIIVSKTPDVQDSKATFTPLRQDLPTGPNIKDPRSPTMEFTRTPINPCYPSPAAARNCVPVTSAVDRRTLEQDVCEPEQYFEADSVSQTGSLVSLRSMESDVCSVTSCQDFSDKDPSLHETEMSPDVVLEASYLDVDVTEGVDKAEYVDMKSLVLLENKLVVRVKSAEESTPKVPVLRSRIGMKPKLLSLSPGVTRSPLSAVHNSPRVLSQRNIQPTYGSKPTQAISVLVDKENIQH